MVNPLSKRLPWLVLAVLVTGATGFVGSRLVDRLVSRGEQVTSLVRQGKTAGSKVVTGDLSYPDFDFDDSYDVVYHLAAVWPGEKDRKLQRRVNFDGTVNLFSKVRDKAKFFIYISGLGVFGDTKGNLIDENTKPSPHTEYAKIRLEAQEYLEENCRQYGIPFSVAYLGDVYGNGGWFKSMMVERLRRNSFKILGSGRYYRTLIHVDDAVSALVAMAEKNQTNQSFIVTDSSPVLFSEFVNYTCSKLGVAKPGTIPAFLAKAALGSDFVTLLTTSTKTSNAKVLNICKMSYPSYQEGVTAVISEMKS
ncbi:MAG TPA: NAD(P)-dependent oxidoreductase [Candidatus Nitrosotalea sp.]|nr:NAD(P)-dependent oxidoreductase [Candidatus Nitrosotalea sp.]